MLFLLHMDLTKYGYLNKHYTDLRIHLQYTDVWIIQYTDVIRFLLCTDLLNNFVRTSSNVRMWILLHTDLTTYGHAIAIYGCFTRTQYGCPFFYVWRICKMTKYGRRFSRLYGCAKRPYGFGASPYMGTSVYCFYRCDESAWNLAFTLNPERAPSLTYRPT